jgi:ABC-2 type transport system permease protein/lipopolysaccharide transport system permease protein
VSVEVDALGPSADLRYRRHINILASVAEVWGARELVYTLAERDLRARYKQAFLGALWAILTPLLMMVVFNFFIKRVGHINTHGAPYPLFSYLGLIPWTFFSTSLSVGGMSLVSNALLSKVYCPREVFPMGSMGVAWVDSLLATIPFIALFLIYGYSLNSNVVYVPVLFAVQICFTLAVTLIFSVLTVYMRDLRLVLPILLQLGLFATPVAYGLELVPKGALRIYGTLNPLAPVIDGYRRIFLYNTHPQWDILVPASIFTALLLFFGYVLFKQLETGIADVS